MMQSSNEKDFRLKMLFVGLSVILAIVFYYWIGSIIKRYDAIYFSVLFLPILVVTSYLLLKMKSHPSLLKALFIGVLLGYFLSLVLNLSLEYFFVPHFLENLTRGFSSEKILQTLIVLFGFPILFGGWLLGGVMSIACYYHQTGLLKER